jgi:hypothetical protein
MFRCLQYLVFALGVAARSALVIGRDVALKDSYDFVIIGGGTSGLTVADRLTENPKSPYLCSINIGNEKS